MATQDLTHKQHAKLGIIIAESDSSLYNLL